jgi:hypothetical protein
MKNPIDCSLFYFALKKKAVLQGLWRMAAWNREQSATIRLLSNNFQDQKWKTAAMKNAYALLGKRRHGKCTHAESAAPAKRSNQNTLPHSSYWQIV